MICHCGRKMHLTHSGNLKVSGLRRDRLQCALNHNLVLWEGVPIESPSKDKSLECALNANEANSGMTPRCRPKALLDVPTIRHIGIDHFSGPDAAPVLSLQSWGLRMRAGHGSLVSAEVIKIRSSSAASSSTNSRNNPPVLAGETEERKAA